MHCPVSVSIKSGAQLNENAVFLKKARNLGEDKAEYLRWKSPRLNPVLQKINTTEEKRELQFSGVKQEGVLRVNRDPQFMTRDQYSELFP